MDKLDYKKEYKDLYLPGKKPVIVEVPQMIFIQVSGRGNPNVSESYQEAIALLYGLSFTIKMSKMNGTQPEGYFEYVVPPLEGLWKMTDINGKVCEPDFQNKDNFEWISMIRQPEFVTEDVFEKAKTSLAKKKPELDVSRAHFVIWKEGLCCQLLHKGAYDDEPETLSIMNAFLEESEYRTDFSETRLHHEIYLSDPRKCKTENLKTVIRHPVRKIK